MTLSFLLVIIAPILITSVSGTEYGSLVSQRLGPGISGSLYIVDEQTLQLVDVRFPRDTRVKVSLKPFSMAL